VCLACHGVAKSKRSRVAKKYFKSVFICLPRLPNEIFVAFISSGFNSSQKTSAAYLTGVSKYLFYQPVLFTIQVLTLLFFLGLKIDGFSACWTY
jgi:hypothetical protein